MAETLTMTLSFRAAWRWGVPHIAGQGVHLVPSILETDAWDVIHPVEGAIRRALYRPQDVRERGGVPRHKYRLQRAAIPATPVMSDGFDGQPEIIADYFTSVADAPADPQPPDDGRRREEPAAR